MKTPLYVRREAAEHEKYLKTEACSLAIKAHNRRNKNSFRMLRDLIRRGVQPSQLSREMANDPLISAVYELAAKTRTEQPVLSLVGQLIRKTPCLIKDTAHHQSVRRVLQFLPQAIRPLEQWKPKGKSRARALADLQRFLYARYPAPAFLERAFLTAEPRYAFWYVEWAQGRSPRSFVNPPIAISKSMAHVLQFAPAALSVPEALRWAQAVSLGADRRRALHIARVFEQVGEMALLATPVDWAHDPDQNPAVFSESLIRFFVANPDLTPQVCGTIADYVFHQKYQFAERTRKFRVKNPNFSMKGRSANALLRAVDEWHRTLGLRDTYRHLPAVWPMAPYQGLEHELGVGRKAKHYSIRQLNKQRELFEEGTKLNHCVASYIGRCVQSLCSIWTMECLSDERGIEKLLTIEVQSDGKILQVRGQCNRLPTEEEEKVLQLWYRKAGLTG